jgi:hypothetical protein
MNKSTKSWLKILYFKYSYRILTIEIDDDYYDFLTDHYKMYVSWYSRRKRFQTELLEITDLYISLCY